MLCHYKRWCLWLGRFPATWCLWLGPATSSNHGEAEEASQGSQEPHVTGKKKCSRAIAKIPGSATGSIICKWKVHETTTNRPWSDVPCKIL